MTFSVFLLNSFTAFLPATQVNVTKLYKGLIIVQFLIISVYGQNTTNPIH